MIKYHVILGKKSLDMLTTDQPTLHGDTLTAHRKFRKNWLDGAIIGLKSDGGGGSRPTAPWPVDVDVGNCIIHAVDTVLVPGAYIDEDRGDGGRPRPPPTDGMASAVAANRAAFNRSPNGAAPSGASNPTATPAAPAPRPKPDAQVPAPPRGAAPDPVPPRGQVPAPPRGANWYAWRFNSVSSRGSAPVSPGANSGAPGGSASVPARGSCPPLWRSTPYRSPFSSGVAWRSAPVSPGGSAPVLPGGSAGAASVVPHRPAVQLRYRLRFSSVSPGGSAPVSPAVQLQAAWWVSFGAASRAGTRTAWWLSSGTASRLSFGTAS